MQRGWFYKMPTVKVAFFRFSILLNACLVMYLCINHYFYDPNAQLIRELSTNSQLILSQSSNYKRAVVKPTSQSSSTDKLSIELGKLSSEKQTNNEIANSIEPSDDKKTEQPDYNEGYEMLESPREEKGAIDEAQPIVSPINETPDPSFDSLERKMYGDLRECSGKLPKPLYILKGNYWILNNYIPADDSFPCDQSITYTTHADYTFLDNLDPLTSRWEGPVSISVYAPGTDFQATVDTILYLRNCMAKGIKKYVTFHLFFHTHHLPKEVPTTEDLLQRVRSCEGGPPKWVNVTTYRQKNKLLYPINVARNTARLNAQTYFVLPSDVELYPSTNFIPEFFKMLKKPDFSTSNNPRVYVFPIFEVEEAIAPPQTKKELQVLLESGKAIPFHQKVCKRCHRQPHSKEWQISDVKPGLSVFAIGRRESPFDKWEPIFVGTNMEPIYDERLSWEGKSDKMTQMYILCVKNYEFHILDTAFLVHKPGIKVYNESRERTLMAGKQNTFIKKTIAPEYKLLFGSKKGCVI